MRHSYEKVVRSLLVVACFPAVGVIGHLIGLGVGSIAFLLFATLAVTAGWAGKWESRDRTLGLQDGTASFSFQPGDPSFELKAYPLRGYGWVVAAVSGELRGLKAWIFDYAIRDQGPADMRKCVSQTVAAFCVDDASLPIFQIRPLGLTCLNDDDSENSDETVCFPDALPFHRRFELRTTAEEGVRRHFNAELLDSLATLNDCDYMVQGYYTTVLVFNYGRILEPEELEALARKGSDIASVLFSSEKRQMAAAAK